MDHPLIPKANSARSTLLSTCFLTIALALNPALRSQQEDASSSRTKALAHERQGQTAEAEQIWSAIAQTDPRNAEALAHLGLLEARQEHYDRAIDFYQRALAIDPNLPGLQMNVGLAMFKAAQFPDAIKAFSAELRKHPDDLRLTTLLGMAHYGMKDYLVAIPYLQRAAERDPQSVTLRMTLANSCLRSRQFQCVLDTHKEINKLNADNAEAEMLAGEALAEMHNRAAAEQQFRAAILKDPKQPHLHFALGYLLWSESKWAESAAEFQLELQNNPQAIDAQVFLADSWVRQNEFAKALAVLKSLTVSEPYEALVHRDLGIIYANDKRTADAIRELTAACEAYPGDPEPHLQLAKLYQAANQQSEASKEFMKAKTLPPQGIPPLEEVMYADESPVP